MICISSNKKHGGMITIVNKLFYFTIPANYIFYTYVFMFSSFGSVLSRSELDTLFYYNYDNMPIGPKTDIVPKGSNLQYK